MIENTYSTTQKPGIIESINLYRLSEIYIKDRKPNCKADFCCFGKLLKVPVLPSVATKSVVIVDLCRFPIFL